ncbi:hypothetical protein JCM16358_03030 [Halanaerocella petrolearia]
MQPVDLFVKLCAKEEVVNLIEAKGIKVKGFNGRISKAPLPFLKSYLKQWLTKKGSRNFTNLINDDFKNKAQLFAGCSLNSFLCLMNREKRELPESIAFGLFLSLFPKQIDEYLPKFVSNWKEDRDIFAVELIDWKITDENANQAINDLYNPLIEIKRLYSEEEKIKDQLFVLAEEEYLECKKEVVDLSWSDFVRNYPKLLGRYSETIVLLSYLLENETEIKKIENKEKIKLHFILFTKAYSQIQEEKIKRLENKIQEQKKELNQLDNIANKLKKITTEKKRVDSDYQIAKGKIDNLEEQNQQLQEKIAGFNQQLTGKNKKIDLLIEKLEQSVSYTELDYLTDCSTKQEIIIVGSKSKLYDLFLGDYVYYPAEVNIEQLKQKLVTDKDYLVLITRSRLNTEQLLAWETKLKKLNIEKEIIVATSEIEFIKEVIRKNLI